MVNHNDIGPGNRDMKCFYCSMPNFVKTRITFFDQKHRYGYCNKIVKTTIGTL